MTARLVAPSDNGSPCSDAVHKQGEAEAEPLACVIGEHGLLVGCRHPRRPTGARLFVGGEPKHVIDDGAGGQVGVRARRACIGGGVGEGGRRSASSPRIGLPRSWPKPTRRRRCGTAGHFAAAADPATRPRQSPGTSPTGSRMRSAIAPRSCCLLAKCQYRAPGRRSARVPACASSDRRSRRCPGSPSPPRPRRVCAAAPRYHNLNAVQVSARPMCSSLTKEQWFDGHPDRGSRAGARTVGA